MRNKIEEKEIACVCGFSFAPFSLGIVVSIFGAIISAKAGVLWVHERFGLTVLGLIIFRVVWGLSAAIMHGFVNSAMPRMRFKSCKHYLNLHQNQSQNRMLR